MYFAIKNVVRIVLIRFHETLYCRLERCDQPGGRKTAEDLEKTLQRKWKNEYLTFILR